MKMYKRLIIASVLSIGAVSGAVYFWFYNWEPAQLQPVVSCDGERFEVRARRQRCLHVVVGHFPLGFMRPGRVEVSLTSEQGRAFEFAAGEDMELFAVHKVGGKIYLVFLTVYDGKGCAVYEYDYHSRRFNEISPKVLPHSAAYPNFGQEFFDARNLLLSQTKVSWAVQESHIGWLWNMIVVGKVHAEDAQALEYFMDNYRDEFLDKMSK